MLDSGGMRNSISNALMPSFDIDDVSSDEELMGIPGPDIPDPEISFSQEKLGIYRSQKTIWRKQLC